MADDLERAGSPDSTRINVNQEHELRGWAESLGTTKERLREAVRTVGDSAKRVRDYLQKRSNEHPRSA